MKYFFFRVGLIYRLSVSAWRGDDLLKFLEILTVLFPFADYLKWFAEQYLTAYAMSETRDGKKTTIEMWNE